MSLVGLSGEGAGRVAGYVISNAVSEGTTGEKGTARRGGGGGRVSDHVAFRSCENTALANLPIHVLRLARAYWVCGRVGVVGVGYTVELTRSSADPSLPGTPVVPFVVA